MIELRTLSSDSADRILGETGYLSDHKVNKKVDRNKLEKLSIKHKRENGYKEIDLTFAKKVLEEAVKNENKFIENKGTFAATTLQEQWIAPRLHYALRLTRNEASDPKIWNYLGLFFEDYILRRWTGDSKGVNTNEKSKPLEYHFLLKKWDRHQLAKLWWMAELTKNNGEYHPQGGIINTDIINYVLGGLAPHSHQYNLALLEMENDVLGNKEFQLNSEWIRAAYRLINRKILHEGGAVKVSFDINYDEAEKWFNEKPDKKLLTFKNTIFPTAPKDIEIKSSEIGKLIVWIREGIQNQIDTEWLYLNNIAKKIVKEAGEPLKREEIFDRAKKEGLLKVDWQKRELGFSLVLAPSDLSQGKDSKWKLN